jgi:cell division protein FtsL
MKRDRLNSELQVLERKIRLLMAEYSQERKKNEDLESKFLELKSLARTERTANSGFSKSNKN